jgi:hypothetical protein
VTSSAQFDRRNMDVGNIVFWDYINMRVPDQVAAIVFFIEGLGLSRDPY